MLTADRATRTLTADPLLPYGEQGRTNLGRVTAAKGLLTIPADVSGMVLNLQHDRNAPRANFTSVTEGPNGLRATFHVPETQAGDDLLAEVESGLRTGVSVEIDDPVIRSGKLLGGTLSAAAAVVDPAFPSARLVAADAGVLPDGFPEMSLPSDSTTESTEEIVVNGVTYLVTRTSTSKTEVKPKDPTADPSIQEQTVTQPTDTAPNAPLAASLPQSLRGKPAGKAEPSMFAQLANADISGREAIKTRLNAALDQAISTDLAPTMVTQWLGEVGAKTTYQPRYMDLVSHDNLTGLKAIGWRFITGKTPQVAAYAGFPVQPNSSEVKTEQVTLDAVRLAGAGEVDRAFIDFPVPEFWAGFYRESTNDYKRKLDGLVRDALITAATAVTGGTVPTGVSTAAAFIVDGAMAVLAQERDLPSFALVGTDLYRELALTKVEDLVALLSGALGLDESNLAGFKIRPSSAAALSSKVLVGARAAATVYELPGASPVRIDTVNIANGGVTTGVFGYHAELVNDATSLALVAAGA